LCQDPSQRAEKKNKLKMKAQVSSDIDASRNTRRHFAAAWKARKHEDGVVSAAVCERENEEERQCHAD